MIGGSEETCPMVEDEIGMERQLLSLLNVITPSTSIDTL